MTDGVAPLPLSLAVAAAGLNPCPLHAPILEVFGLGFGLGTSLAVSPSIIT